MLPPYGLCLPCTEVLVSYGGTLDVQAGGRSMTVRLDILGSLAPGALAWIRTTLDNGTPLSLVVTDVGEIARMLGGERNIRGEIYLGTEDKLSDLLRHTGHTIPPET